MGDVELVPLYRCRECRARMFERDCQSHLERHGIDGEWRKHFIRGKKDTPSRPGDQHRPLNYRQYRKRTRPVQA